jgi:hypothetical protein
MGNTNKTNISVPFEVIKAELATILTNKIICFGNW